MVNPELVHSGKWIDKIQKVKNDKNKVKVTVRIADNQTYDCLVKRVAIEVERSGDSDKLKHAAERLKKSDISYKILKVPSQDIDRAVKAMRDVGVNGTVKNFSGTRRSFVVASNQKNIAACKPEKIIVKK